MKPKIKVKESDILKSILDYLRWCGVFCWRNRTVGIWNEKGQGYIPAEMKGVSDISAVWQGRHIAIECKVPGNKPTDAQKEFLNNVIMSGGIAFIATSIEDVEENLKDLM